MMQSDTFISHLVELRQRLVRALVAVLAPVRTGRGFGSVQGLAGLAALRECIGRRLLGLGAYTGGLAECAERVNQEPASGAKTVRNVVLCLAGFDAPGVYS